MRHKLGFMLCEARSSAGRNLREVAKDTHSFTYIDLGTFERCVRDLRGMLLSDAVEIADAYGLSVVDVVLAALHDMGLPPPEPGFKFEHSGWAHEEEGALLMNSYQDTFDKLRVLSRGRFDDIGDVVEYCRKLRDQ
jgi:hypothetical protein